MKYIRLVALVPLTLLLFAQPIVSQTTNYLGTYTGTGVSDSVRNNNEETTRFFLHLTQIDTVDVKVQGMSGNLIGYDKWANVSEEGDFVRYVTAAEDDSVLVLTVDGNWPWLRLNITKLAGGAGKAAYIRTVQGAE